MWKKLKQSLHKSQSLHDLTRSKLKKHQQDWRKLQKQNEEDLCRMYFSVMNRPFLFESQAQIPVRSSKAVPPQLRKRSKKQVRGNASKHIHQSPLKGYEVEDHDSK